MFKVQKKRFNEKSILYTIIIIRRIRKIHFISFQYYFTLVYLVFQENQREDLQTYVDAEKFQWQVQRKIDQGEPGMVWQGETQWGLQAR